MKSLLGTIVVENIGGGAGSLGAAAVARANPDGYTLLVSGTNVHVNEALLPFCASPLALGPSPSIRRCRRER
jgi:tripartite-type tricarboxylate transporter receptor subunit TctC